MENIPEEIPKPELSIEQIKANMIEEAKKQHGEIFPVINKENLDDCFTFGKIRGRQKTFFWFNDAEQGTHVIAVDL